MSLQSIPNVTIVVAVTENNIIGCGNTIPWKLKSDMKHFKETTQGGVVIMGRKTWESLPVRPLPKRTNVVISRTAEELDGAIIFPSLDEALAHFNDKVEEVFVIGGGELYKEALPKASKIICTHISSNLQHGVKFPKLDSAYWTAKSSKQLMVTEDDKVLATTDIEELLDLIFTEESNKNESCLTLLGNLRDPESLEKEPKETFNEVDLFYEGNLRDLESLKKEPKENFNEGDTYINLDKNEVYVFYEGNWITLFQYVMSSKAIDSQLIFEPISEAQVVYYHSV